MLYVTEIHVNWQTFGVLSYVLVNTIVRALTAHHLQVSKH